MKLLHTSDTELTLIRAILYGDSGAGKTTSLKTLPLPGTLLAVCERDTLPLRNENYPVVYLENWLDVQALYLALTGQDTGNKALADLVTGKRILVIESLNEIADLCMTHILTVDRPNMVKDRTKNERTSPKGVYEDAMTIEDWGTFGRRMLNLISVFCHLPIHVIFTCIAAWPKGADGNDAERHLGIPGKMVPMGCPKLFGLVLYMHAMETEDPNEDRRVWRTFNDDKIYAKDSTGILDRFEEPDWTKLFTKILGTKGKTQ